jgi:hypothetical protein
MNYGTKERNFQRTAWEKNEIKGIEEFREKYEKSCNSAATVAHNFPDFQGSSISKTKLLIAQSFVSIEF